VRAITILLLTWLTLISDADAFFSKCSKLEDVIARHKNDMFLHKKINARGITEYVWVRSGRNGDIEFVYHLKDGKLCLYEKHTY
jgi:hypothetical protein